MKRRQYTLDDYKRDVARLYAIRRSDAPGVCELLDEALAADTELAAVDAELTGDMDLTGDVELAGVDMELSVSDLDLSVADLGLTSADLELTAADLELTAADIALTVNGDLALTGDSDGPGPISLVRRLRPRAT